MSQYSAGRILLLDFPFDFMLCSKFYFCGDNEQLARLMYHLPLVVAKNIVGMLITAKWRARVPQTCSLNVSTRREANTGCPK